MNDYLSVGFGPENVTFGGKIPPQLPVIIDLAVERDPDTLVLIAQRLVAARQVDDRKPAVTQSDSGGCVDSTIIRSTVPYGVEHIVDQSWRDLSTVLEDDLTA